MMAKSPDFPYQHKTTAEEASPSRSCDQTLEYLWTGGQEGAAGKRKKVSEIRRGPEHLHLGPVNTGAEGTEGKCVRDTDVQVVVLRHTSSKRVIVILSLPFSEHALT